MGLQPKNINWEGWSSHGNLTSAPWTTAASLQRMTADLGPPWGPRRSVNTALIRAQSMLSPGTLMSGLPSPTCALSSSPPPRVPSPFKTIQNSCSCLLLVRSVVVWEPNDFILSHGEPMGTQVHSSISRLGICGEQPFNELQRLLNNVLRTTGNSPKCTPVRDLTYTIMWQNCAGNKQKSYKIIKMKMYAILDKAKPHTENIRGLNLAVVKRTTVVVSPKWGSTPR
jgi:hypothetical protein